MIVSRFPRLAYLVVCLLSLFTLRASFAAESEVPAYKPIERKLPPQGIKISTDDRAQLQAKLDELNAKIAELPNEFLPALLDPLRRTEPVTDVAMYAKAVEFALRFDEFYQPEHVQLAEKLLDTGIDRANQLAAGQADWRTQRSLVVRGFRSSVDGSVQPYGLFIPTDLDLKKKFPLYV